MARKLRIEYPGAIYHVVNRGNYRKDLFDCPGTAEAFLKTLAEAVDRHGWRLFAYVLMKNHYHLAIETPQANLVAGMHWFQSTVATRFNRFRKESGHLFQGRYQSILIEDAAALARVVDYIHLNPVRARVVNVEHLGNYRWSSLFHYQRGTSVVDLSAQPWLQIRSGAETGRAAWTVYREYLAMIAQNESEQNQQGLVGLSRGWAIGTLGWRKALAKEFAHTKLSPGFSREQLSELKLVYWESILNECLIGIKKTRAELPTRPMMNEWKLGLARELRARGASVGWIAEQLVLGRPASVRSYLSRLATSGINKQRPDPVV